MDSITQFGRCNKAFYNRSGRPFKTVADLGKGGVEARARSCHPIDSKHTGPGHLKTLQVCYIVFK